MDPIQIQVLITTLTFERSTYTQIHSRVVTERQINKEKDEQFLLLHRINRLHF